jgi:hypothetical protein
MIKFSDNSINPFLEVKFRRIRVSGDYFGFPDKLRSSFNTFVGLPTIAAKINVFSEIFSVDEALFSFSVFSTKVAKKSIWRFDIINITFIKVNKIKECT